MSADNRLAGKPLTDKPWIDDGESVTVRRATPADGSGLARLAVLDSASTPSGDILVAEVDGELWAALSLVDGQIVADPFRPTALARGLLALRARHLDTASTRRHRVARRLLSIWA